MSKTLTAVLAGIAYVIFTPLLGGLLTGLDRKITAHVQRRKGPPVLQPFYDVFKLLGKENASINSAQDFYVGIFLLFTILSGIFFFTGGDILMVMLTATLAGVCLVVAAYSSNSPFSQMGAERELMQDMSYEPMLLVTAIGFYLVTGSFRVEKIISGPRVNIAFLPGIFIGLCFALIIKFRKSPFDISMSHEAHQEIVQGVVTEFSGPMLAMVQLAHWYENVVLFGIVALFFVWDAPWSFLLGLACCAGVFILGIVIDNSCARVKWQHMLRSSWIMTLAAGCVNLLVLMAMR